MLITICRLYESYPDAAQAVEALQTAGVPVQDISLISNNSEGWYDSNQNTGAAARGSRSATSKSDATTARSGSTSKSGTTETPGSGRTESGVVGAAIGATAGIAGSLIASLVALAIPGVGPAVGAGWLLGMMAAGAAVGGATGGLLGALADAGVSESDAAVYAEGVRRGGSVVAARVSPADAKRTESVMSRGAVDTGKRGDEYRQSGWRFFKADATPYTADQVRNERELHRAA